MSKIESRCGLLCSKCSFSESHNCGGSVETNGHPFHGECPVAKCSQDKGFTHCGKLHAYSYTDPDQGDNPAGARVEQCKRWAKES